MQDKEVARFKASNEELNSLQKFVGSISGLMNPLTYVVVNISIIVLIWSGAVRVNEGTLSTGQVVALYNYMSQILVELIKLANLIISITKALACANRIDNIFAVESSMREGSIEYGSSVGGEADKDGGVIADNRGEGTVEDEAVPAVEFKNVSLRYANAGEDSVTGVTFKAMKGQTIGIIGSTGSGKTTLVNMITRFYDATSGEVLVNGRNIKDYTFDSLREKVVVVMQKAQLFKGTIRDNIKWGKPDASDEEIMDALKVAQAKEFVESKPGVLDAFVDQGGKNFSGGQKQRLTIARAVVRKPDILILDDSASALDYATDAALRKSISNMEPMPTLFIVSQRAASLMHADMIIVLDDGEVVGIGTHDQLINNCKVYQEIYYSQFKREQR